MVVVYTVNGQEFVYRGNNLSWQVDAQGNLEVSEGPRQISTISAKTWLRIQVVPEPK